jgi:hypothetical protein
MFETRGKRLIAATAAAAALIGFAAGPAAAQQAAFARIAVSDKSAVYVRIQGGELRTAMSAEGLQTAAPVKMTRAESTHVVDFPEFTLPVPADQLPAGFAPIKAHLMWIRWWSGGSTWPVPEICGQLTVRRTDDRKAEWQYVSGVEVEAGTSAENAPTIKLPSTDHAKLVLRAAPSKGRLAVGLRLADGDAALSDIRKDGQPPQVKMTVTDASGAEVASKVGTPADFGFS